MENTLQFLQAVGRLKDIQRRGILLYGLKKADSATDHTFRLVVMAWLFGNRRRLNLSKAFKLALVHDLCKVYTGDITPYEGLLAKNDKDGHKLAWRWRRLTLAEKQKRFKQKFRKEKAAMQKLTKILPSDLKKDFMDIWLEYQECHSPEAKFVAQLDRIENLLEAFEMRKTDKRFPTLPWWEHADEVVHDKELLELMEEISRAELQLEKK